MEEITGMGIRLTDKEELWHMPSIPITIWVSYYKNEQSIKLSNRQTPTEEISVVEVLKPLQKPWTISLAQRWIIEDRNESRLILKKIARLIKQCENVFLNDISAGQYQPSSTCL